MNLFVRNLLRRKTKWIDRKQQTRFAIEFMVVLALFPLLVFAITLSPYISDLILGDRAPRIQQDMIELYLLIRQLWWVLLIATVFTIALTIYMSHRIFGPVYRINAILKAKLEDRPVEVSRLRKGDYFVDLLNQINLLIEKYENK